jgi:pimeloyl-ACP methyl ester carboxylesterase
MLYFKPYEHQDQRDWVVFVHGVGGSSTIWFKQLRYYRKHFSVLLVDLRGHGQSQNKLDQAIQSKYSFEDISKDVLEVLDHLEIEKAHFVGVSMGTIVIRTIGEIAPERVLSMVMGGAVTKLNLRSKFLMWVANQIKRIVPFLWLYKLYAFILMPRKHHKESRVLFINEAKKLASREIFRWFTISSQVTPLLKYFEQKEVKSPVLYVMGEEDYMFLPQVQLFVKEQKNAILEIFEHCGHVVNVEQPELFNELSVNFMKDPFVFIQNHQTPTQ